VDEDFGQVRFRIEDPLFPLEVWTRLDCVNVFPQPPWRAGMWASGIITRVVDPTGLWFIFEGDRVYFSAFDGGEPSAEPVDNLESWYDIFGGASCELLDAYQSVPDVTHGNIVMDLG
jgi:hypothetical protein